MANNTITRIDLIEAINREVGLPRNECADLLGDALKMITGCLVEGGPFKVSSFGSFTVRHKAERMGRNPRTGEEHTVSSRKVVVFRPSRNLKHRVNQP
ncbi:MAG: integration host factor subunit alpha [Rhodospirillales bacterium]|jgi:integration host factor subunit alpha|nr:integration host factor subunit alpha [Rhodospirillales bacterium]